MPRIPPNLHKFLATVLPFACALQAWALAPDTIYTRYRSAFNTPDIPALKALASSLQLKGDARCAYLAVSAGSALRREEMSDCMHFADSLLNGCGTIAPHWRTDAYKLQAQVHLWSGDLERGLAAIHESISLADSIALPNERIASLCINAELCLAKTDQANALSALNEAQRIVERVDDLRGECMVKLLLGNLRFQQKEFETALDLFLGAHLIASAGGWPLLARNALSNWASCNLMLKRYDIAFDVCDSLLKIPTTEASVRAQLLSHQGYIRREQGRPEDAIAPLQQAILLSGSIGEAFEALKAEQHLAGAFWMMGRKQEAIDLLEKNLNQAKALGRPRTALEIHRSLKRWYTTSGALERAIEHTEAYSALNDSLNEVKFSERTARAEVRFQTERKDHRIAEQQQALALAAAEDRRKNIQRFALAVGVLGTSIIALLLWRSLRNRRKIAAQEKQLHEQQVDELMHSNEIGAINAMLEGQEKERDRMAKDLHDRLGAMLSTIKMQVSALEDKVELVRDDQRDQYGKVNRLLDEAVGEVRRISYDMVTVTLSRFGLAKALESLCEAVRVTGRLDVELRLHGLEQRMERSLEIVVYRMVQELISNVLKHARATEISVSVTRSPGRLSVMVSDDGIGFDVHRAQRGIGLENVQSRAASIGAKLIIDSTPGKGTTVSVEGPVVE